MAHRVTLIPGDGIGPELTEATRADLDLVMPGTQSDLERHEWFKHGTCYSDTPEEFKEDGTNR